MGVNMQLSKIVTPKFRKSLDRLSSQELPIKAMFHLKGVVKILKEEINKWDELQLEAAKKWADKNEHGQAIIEKNDGKTILYKMKHENMLQFAAELGELAKIEIDVPTINIADLGSSVKLTTDDLIELDFLRD